MTRGARQAHGDIGAEAASVGALGVDAQSSRLHWIDWLRVAAIAGVFAYHTLRPFDATGWHVKNAETDGLIGAAQIFFATFGLAVLFLLAGAGAGFALRRRRPRAFLRERTSRLLVPFVAGTLLLSPIQASVEAAHRGEAASPLPDFVGWWSAIPGAIAGHGLSPSVFGIGYHLWFLGFLFAISVVALPICVALRRPRGARAIDGLAAGVAARRGSTLAFAAPIAVLMLAFATLGTDEHDWAELGWYLACYVIGFVLVADDRFVPAVRRDLPVALAVAAGGTVALVGLDFGEWFTSSASRGLDPRSLAIVLLFVLEGWASTLVVLNVGLRAAAFRRPVSRRAAETVLPVYVLHQPVIVAAAFVIVQWPVGILPKWLALFGISAAVTLVLVELALRAPVARALLGARRRAAGSAEAPGRRAAREGAGLERLPGVQHAARR